MSDSDSSDDDDENENDSNNDECNNEAIITQEEEPEITTFSELGVQGVLLEAITAIGWAKPTVIQQQAIPEALAGRDVIGLAETG